MKLTFVADNDTPVTNLFLNTLVFRLQDRGINAAWVREMTRAIASKEIILAHDPIPPPSNPGQICVLGQRLLNRRQRLVVLEESRIPVVPWAAPPLGPGIDGLFDRWTTTRCLHKKDTSFRRREVRVVTRGAPVDHNPEEDVFMAIVDEDPTTYKIDMFCGQVLGGRAYHTPPIDDPEFYNDEIKSELLDIPPTLADVASAAGCALMAFGAGYMSLDFMRYHGGFAIIEANTSGVGIETMWALAPAMYLDHYERAIMDWLMAGGADVSLETLASRCRSLDSLPGAYDPEERL